MMMEMMACLCKLIYDIVASGRTLKDPWPGGLDKTTTRHKNMIMCLCLSTHMHSSLVGLNYFYSFLITITNRMSPLIRVHFLHNLVQTISCSPLNSCKMNNLVLFCSVTKARAINLCVYSAVAPIQRCGFLTCR